MKCEIPVYEKSNLTLEEAAAYFNIGINKLREITDSGNCPFVLWVGNKRLIKRKKLDKWQCCDGNRQKPQKWGK